METVKLEVIIFLVRRFLSWSSNSAFRVINFRFNCFCSTPLNQYAMLIQRSVFACLKLEVRPSESVFACCLSKTEIFSQRKNRQTIRQTLSWSSQTRHRLLSCFTNQQQANQLLRIPGSQAHIFEKTTFRGNGEVRTLPSNCINFRVHICFLSFARPDLSKHDQAC